MASFDVFPFGLSRRAVRMSMLSLIFFKLKAKGLARGREASNQERAIILAGFSRRLT